MFMVSEATDHLGRVSAALIRTVHIIVTRKEWGASDKLIKLSPFFTFYSIWTLKLSKWCCAHFLHRVFWECQLRHIQNYPLLV